MSETGGIATDQLRSLIERVERAETEIDELKSDRKDIFAEAKGSGFNVPTMRKVIALRKLEPAERAESEAILDLYLHALGMQTDLPMEMPVKREPTKRGVQENVRIDVRSP